MRVPPLIASQHRATRLTPPPFLLASHNLPSRRKKIDVTYKIGKIAIINPIFYASGLFIPVANSPAAAANPIKVFRGAPRRRAGAARLSWSNGATARPLAAPQPRGASPSGPAERGPRGPGHRDREGRWGAKGVRKRRAAFSSAPLSAESALCDAKASPSSHSTSNKRDKMGLLLKTSIVSNSETKQLIILLWRGKAGAVNR